MTEKGFIVHAETFEGAESPPQRYIFVAKVAARLPELSAMMHDDACHLRRFSEKHAWRSELCHRLVELHCFLDRMHAKTHKDPWCLAHCHPDVNEAIMAGFNSSAVESCNGTIGRHRFATRHMRPFVRSFFLLEVIVSRNALSPACSLHACLHTYAHTHVRACVCTKNTRLSTDPGRIRGRETVAGPWARDAPVLWARGGPVGLWAREGVGPEAGRRIRDLEMRSCYL